MEPIRKKGNSPMKVNRYKELEYLTFPLLEKTGMVRHLFSTRTGGVSEGQWASMNLSYTRGDKKESVDENFRRIAEVFGTTPGRIVCSKQTHTTNVRLVTEKDCGKGIIRPADYEDVDGLICGEPGIVLCTLYADCVPLYFVDVEKKAVGLGHSGWRGTAGRMGEAVLKAMHTAFGTRPEHVLAAIGPSICRQCYEVSEEVAHIFRQEFSKESEDFLEMGKEQGKYQLDLWEANRRVLLDAGILPQNLAVTDLCTCCNSRYLFSHRASQGKRGNLGAFLELINS
ncbi:MAG: peptidoglycan editing factor PgeF [Lachnospiraceae bacterium]|nr:peptidoglycan editing factor PgeF [Lachnospiraceae bacterium]